jgi:hypothetical protein
MADQKISALSALTTPDAADVLPIVDHTGPTTKKITWANILTALASTFQSALGFTPENVANKKTGLSDNSDTYYPSQKAVKTAVDAKQDSLGFTPENVANKDTDGTLSANSDTKYPSQKAVKTYVDGHASTPVFASGLATQTGNSTTTLTIAHGMGKTPARVMFTWGARQNITNGGGWGTGYGVFDASGQRCFCMFNGNGNGQHSTNGIVLEYSGGRLTGTVSVDGTNITISWSNSSGEAVVFDILWQAE